MPCRPGERMPPVRHTRFTIAFHPLRPPVVPPPRAHLPQPTGGALVRKALVLTCECRRIPEVRPFSLIDTKVGVVIIERRPGRSVAVCSHVRAEWRHGVLIYFGDGLRIGCIF